MTELIWQPVLDRPDLLATPVHTALDQVPVAAGWEVAEIDPELADTAALVAGTDIMLRSSANCLVVRARRGGTETLAAAVVLATTRADINTTIRKVLGARKCSFLSMDAAVAATGMEYGGITPVGLPADWPVLVDSRVIAEAVIVIGSGTRRAKIRLPGAQISEVPGVQVIDDLAVPGD